MWGTGRVYKSHRKAWSVVSTISPKHQSDCKHQTIPGSIWPLSPRLPERVNNPCRCSLSGQELAVLLRAWHLESKVIMLP
jgi:hypothetical protein